MTAHQDTSSVRANAFDLLRLIGALLVIVEHSWVLTGHGAPMSGRTGSGFGSIGVGIFFLTSGYLISTSWVTDPSPRRYAIRRALRIYPAYLVVIVGSTFVLGPLLTSLSTPDYFGHAGTWGYLGRNLAVFPVTYDLPGVFGTVPQPHVVNGSLWTIRVEMLCYLGVVLLGVCGLLRRRLTLIVIATVGLGLATAIHVSGYDGALIPKLLGADAAEPLAFFALGMLARHFGPRIAPPWWIPVAAVAVWVACWGTPVANLAAIVAVATSTFTVAFRSPAALHHPTRGWDLSYGTYVLAFPVQQILVQLGISNPWLLLPAAVAIVLPMAAVSWRFVERPVLQHKPRKPVQDNPVSARAGVLSGWLARR